MHRGISPAPGYRDARRLEGGLHLLVAAGLHLKRDVIQIAARGGFRRLTAFEQSQLLLSATEEDPAGILVGHLHAKQIHVKLSGTVTRP